MRMKELSYTQHIHPSPSSVVLYSVPFNIMQTLRPPTYSTQHSHLCIVMFLHVIHLYDMIIILSYMQMVMSAVLQRGTVIFKKTESPNPKPHTPVKPASSSPGKSRPKLGVIGRRETLAKSPTKYVKPEQASSLAELKKRLEVMLFLS